MDENSRGQADAAARTGQTRPRRSTLRLSVFVAAALGLAALLSAAPFSSQANTARAATTTASPIQHVVVLLMENHSFDNVLGKFCNEVSTRKIVRPGPDAHCNGVVQGTEANGTVVPLAPAIDLVPQSGHEVQTQVADIDGGKMDGFNATGNCQLHPKVCYSQFDPQSGPCALGSCIPNLSTLATDYTVSDSTFELYTSPSFEGHEYFVTANQDGFLGNNPHPAGYFGAGVAPTPVSQGGGWGCDSGDSTYWVDPTTKVQSLIPSCIADKTGSLGPNWAGYTGVKAPYVPTIFDELDARSMSWKIYGGTGSATGAGGTGITGESWNAGYMWAICPTFAECLYSKQANNLVPASNVVTDAAAGQLPSFSIIAPTATNSQHNTNSMSKGDDYIGQVISALQSGPEWSSTAVFITYDDCGCFYDHVNPLQYNSQWGIRVPMVIVSPYAKPGYTDSHPTTFAGILAFVEHNFGLPALNSNDKTAYNYTGAFCLNTANGCSQAGTGTVTMVNQFVPKPTASQLAAQKAAADDDT
jgi:phospholipase C